MSKFMTYIFFLVLFLSACSPKDTARLPIEPTATNPDMGEFVIKATETIPTLESGSVILENDECDNPYFPVVNGASWQYNLSTGISTLHSMTTGSDKTFTITVESEKNEFTLDGSCTDDGIILLDVPGISSTYSGEDGSSTLTTTNDDGVTLPNDVQIGDDWSQTISVTGSSDGNVTLSAQIDSDYKAIGYEIVSTPLGPINALKVENTGSLSMRGEAVMDTHGFIWYGQGIGVVKNTVDDTFEAILDTYNIPQP